MSNGIFDEQQPLMVMLHFTGGAGTTFQTLVSGYGVKVRFDSILVRNLDSIDHVVEVGLQPAGLNGIVGSINVPAATSLVATLPVDLVPTVLANPQGGLVVGPLATVNIRVVVAVATGDLFIVGLGATV